MLDATRKHLQEFADDGLRTLAVAQRQIPEGEFRSWHQRFTSLCKDPKQLELRREGKPNKIEQCMEEIEVKLELLGATAIEDKLQDEVPETIYSLAQAGIKIWVLTGDKQETAINIGFACQLVNKDMVIYTLNGKDVNKDPTGKTFKTKEQCVSACIVARLVVWLGRFHLFCFDSDTHAPSPKDSSTNFPQICSTSRSGRLCLQKDNTR